MAKQKDFINSLAAEQARFILQPKTCEYCGREATHFDARHGAECAICNDMRKSWECKHGN